MIAGRPQECLKTSGGDARAANLGPMTLRTDSFDVGALRLLPGDGRRLELAVAIEPYELGGESYPVVPELIGVRLDISCTNGPGYVLRLRFDAALSGPCMRCLEAAEPAVSVDATEVSLPGDVPELQSPYVEHGVLDLAAWSRDALALALPAQVRCRPDCAGLCPVCGADLNTAGPEHAHESEPDPRWARLSELKFD
jgi:uncharacterized protein